MSVTATDWLTNGRRLKMTNSRNFHQKNVLNQEMSGLQVQLVHAYSLSIMLLSGGPDRIWRSKWTKYTTLEKKEFQEWRNQFLCTFYNTFLKSWCWSWVNYQVRHSELFYQGVFCSNLPIFLKIFSPIVSELVFAKICKSNKIKENAVLIIYSGPSINSFPSPWLQSPVTSRYFVLWTLERTLIQIW